MLSVFLDEHPLWLCNTSKNTKELSKMRQRCLKCWKVNPRSGYVNKILCLSVQLQCRHWLQCHWQSPVSSFLLPPLHSYTSSTGLGSPCMGGSTGSIQPGTKKTGIFIENAASLFLLPKTEYRTTPHVGGDAGIGSSSNEWETIRQQHRDLVQDHFCSAHFRIFSLRVSECLFSFCDTMLQWVLL